MYSNYFALYFFFSQQAITATIVKQSPADPRVGEAVYLTFAYQTTDSQVQQRIYSYQDTDGIIFNRVSFQSIKDDMIFATMVIHPKHSGIVFIPSIVENHANHIQIPHITVRSSIYNEKKEISWEHAPFSFVSLLHTLGMVIALLLFAKMLVSLYKILYYIAYHLIKNIQNTVNRLYNYACMKQLFYIFKNMENPKSKNTPISTDESYIKMYQSLQKRFLFLYGRAFSSHTTKEVRKILMENILDISSQHKVKVQHASTLTTQETVDDFFTTLESVLYGKKTVELATRKIHCQFVMQVIQISKYLTKIEHTHSQNTPSHIPVFQRGV